MRDSQHVTSAITNRISFILGHSHTTGPTSNDSSPHQHHNAGITFLLPTATTSHPSQQAQQASIMDELSNEDALAIAQLESQPQRPSRGVKPTGFYKPVNPLRAPRVTSRSNMVPKDRVPKDTGKRKRAETPPSGDEGEQAGSSGMGGNGEGEGDGEGDGDGGSEDTGNGKDSGNGKSDTKAKAKGGKKVKPKEEAPPERTPPPECAVRSVKKDRNLKILDEGPKMEDGDAPRFYAKV